MTPELALEKVTLARAILSLIRSYTFSYNIHSCVFILQVGLLGFAIGGQVYQGRYLPVIALNIVFLIFNIHRILVIDRERNLAEHRLLKVVKELRAAGIPGFEKTE